MWAVFRFLRITWPLALRTIQQGTSPGCVSSIFQILKNQTFNKDELYPIGLGQNNKNENIADLFRLKEGDSGEFVLTKMASKAFDGRKEASFEYGAGAFLGPAGEFKIVACGYNMEKTSSLNFFETGN